MGLSVDVLVDGARSEVLSSRVRSLTVTDSIGHEADSAVLAISVAKPLEVVIPRIGARISFAVGRDGGQAVPLGDPLLTTGISGDARAGSITIEAEAIGPSSPLREQRDASWTGKSIGEIVEAIAARAGLVPAVSEKIADVVPMGAIQVAESDRQFLHRLLREVNARFLPKDGRLVVLVAGERVSASGGDLPALSIDLSDGSWVRWRRADTGVRGSVSAKVYGPDGSTILTVQAGSGTPRRRLPGVRSSPDDALAAAERMLLKARSSQDWIDIERTLTPRARALYPLTLTGAPEGFSGDLTIQEVRHTVAGQVARTVIRARP